MSQLNLLVDLLLYAIIVINVINVIKRHQTSSNVMERYIYIEGFSSPIKAS
jgi:hypothetical protein